MRIAYGRAISDTNDGGHLYWHCRAKVTKGVTCDSVNCDDTLLRDAFCRTMGVDSFDEELFNRTVDRIVVQPSGSIDFYLKDGKTKTFEAFRLRWNIHEATRTEEFRGKIRCGCCGSEYGLCQSREKYIYWICKGKGKRMQTRCQGKNLQDSHLRRISAHMMGTDTFDGEAFKSAVEAITVLPDGSLEYRFTDGRTKTWQKI